MAEKPRKIIALFKKKKRKNIERCVYLSAILYYYPAVYIEKFENIKRPRITRSSILHIHIKFHGQLGCIL